MRKPIAAAAGSAVFFMLAPGVVAGLVPWWLTGWRVRQPLLSWAWAPLRVAGVGLLAAGGIVLIQTFVRFVVEGGGTPAPVGVRPAATVDHGIHHRGSCQIRRGEVDLLYSTVGHLKPCSASSRKIEPRQELLA